MPSRLGWQLTLLTQPTVAPPGPHVTQIWVTATPVLPRAPQIHAHGKEHPALRPHRWTDRRTQSGEAEVIAAVYNRVMCMHSDMTLRLYLANCEACRNWQSTRKSGYVINGFIQWERTPRFNAAFENAPQMNVKQTAASDATSRWSETKLWRSLSACRLLPL